jgi:hypothetical protein
MSKLTASAVLIRNAGANAGANNNPVLTGKSFGGTYYPASGENSARWESTFFHNIPGRNGQPDRRVPIKITAFNGRTAPAGKGLADNCAKYIPAGKEIAVELDIVHWDSRIFVDGKVVLNSAGQPHLEPKVGFRMKSGTLQLVRDSNKQVAMEIQNWQKQPGVISFFSRPPQWNVMGTPDEQIWRQQILPFRTAAVYQGGPEYGYARVAGATSSAGYSAGNSSVLSTEGFTIEQYRAKGWSDEQMLADNSGKFGPFIQAGLIGQNLTGGPTGPTGPTGPNGPSGYTNYESGSGAF